MGTKLVIVRYEDMVSSLESLNPVFSFCGVTPSDADKMYLHQKSLQKWKNDVLFGFSLSNEAIQLAEKYGYKKDELTNGSRLLWPIAKVLSRIYSFPERD